MIPTSIEEITLEMARLEREATRRVTEKIASRQLGLAFINLEGDDYNGKEATVQEH